MLHTPAAKGTDEWAKRAHGHSHLLPGADVANLRVWWAPFFPHVQEWVISNDSSADLRNAILGPLLSFRSYRQSQGYSLAGLTSHMVIRPKAPLSRRSDRRRVS
jgi:hypothetical protein